MIQDDEVVELYFDWLCLDAMHSALERKKYEGVLRVLHDIPFYWTIWSDSNRAGDALAYRQYEFLSTIPQEDRDRFDQQWLEEWASATPSVLEVFVGIAIRWSLYFEGPISVFFWHLFHNMELDRYPGRSLASSTQSKVRTRVDNWMSRQFESDGRGSPFPVDLERVLHVLDMREFDIWSQMNAYSLVHFQ